MWQKIVHWFTSSIRENYNHRTCGEHVVHTNCFFVFVLTFKTIYAHIMFSLCSELVVFMYWTGKSMNNLLSHCGLVDARISASEKELRVLCTNLCWKVGWQNQFPSSSSPFKNIVWGQLPRATDALAIGANQKWREWL